MSIDVHPSAGLPRLEADDHEHVGRLVGSLHAFVRLTERVRLTRVLRLVALALLNILDVITTAIILGDGGVELNPILAPVVHMIWIPVLAKGSVIALVWVLVMRCSVRSRSASVMLTGIVTLYAGVVAFNVVGLLAR